MINAIYKEIGKKPIEIQIKDTVQAMELLVGGHFHWVNFADDYAIICRDDTRNLEENCRLLNYQFMGNILIVGTNNGKFVSVPDKAMELLFPIPKTPDELISVLRNTKSHSKRLLLDSAADMIEELKSQNEMLLREIEK